MHPLLNETAERKVCSALHLDGHRAYRECLRLELSESDFALPTAKDYWQRFCAFMREHPHCESDDIGAEKWLKDGLTADVYNWLTGLCPTWLEMLEAIEEVRRLALRRQLAGGAARVGEVAQTSPDDLPAAVAALSRVPLAPQQAQTFRQLADAQAEAVRNPQPENALGMIHWPWLEMERAFQPVRMGELVVLAARPAIGKSSLARQLVIHSAIAGHPCYVASLEVAGPDFFDGLAMSASGHPKTDKEQFLEAAARLRELPLIFDGQSRSLSAIGARAVRAKDAGGLDLLVIDYLGLLADCVPQRGQNKTQAVGDAAGACKRLAGELGCMLLLIVQLSRAMVNDNREPRLTDLRDSGEIEAHADRVILLHQPAQYSVGNTPTEKQSPHDPIGERPRWFTQIFQEKGRTVGTAAAAMWFNRAVARFELIAR